MIAMGHELMHAYDSNSSLFRSESTIAASKFIIEGRAVSFENYLRSIYNLSPYRTTYGGKPVEFNIFSELARSESVSDFTLLNSSDTSYRFSYTKEQKVRLKDVFGNDTNRIKAITKTYYGIVNIDNGGSLSYQIFDNKEDYENASQN